MGLKLRSRLFRDLFAAAVIFHHFSSVAIPVGLFRTHTLIPAAFAGAVSTVLALLALAAPSNAQYFMLLLAFTLLDFIAWLPYSSSHVVLLAFAAAAVLSQVIKFRRPVSFDIEPAIASIRAMAVAMYGLAAFHKINKSFVNSESSCAVESYRVFQESIPILPNAVIPLLPAMVIAIELLLCASLAVPKFRLLGVKAALVFHFILGFQIERHFFNFSAAAFAILSVFIQERALESSAYGQIDTPAGRFVRNCFVFLFGSVFLLELVSVFNPAAAEAFFISRYLVWWLFSATVLAAFFRVRRAEEHGLPNPVRPLLASLLVVAFIFNGLFPYLGIRNRSSFDMYSNLSVEGGRSNHFIMPPSANIGGRMNDVVRIEKTNDPFLQRRFIDRGYDTVRFELESRFQEAPQYTTTYSARGEVQTHSGAAERNGVSEPIARKLFWFRPVDSAMPADCQW